jgi:hypothetical protein
VTGAAVTNNETMHLSRNAEVAVVGKRTFTNIADVENPAEDRIGIASSASQGAITAKQLDVRPFMRQGEVLETVPGVIITQHSGEGKANRYFMRGFNLDHGSDFAMTVAGAPVNMGTTRTARDTVTPGRNATTLHSTPRHRPGDEGGDQGLVGVAGRTRTGTHHFRIWGGRGDGILPKMPGPAFVAGMGSNWGCEDARFCAVSRFPRWSASCGVTLGRLAACLPFRRGGPPAARTESLRPALENRA